MAEEILYKRYWEVEPKVVSEVIRDHKKWDEKVRAHPWWHAGVVSDFTGRLLWKKTEDERQALIGEAAGWFHSVDYYGDWEECFPRYRALSNFFTDEEWKIIAHVAQNHAKRPDGSESKIMKCLQVADRFATMGLVGAFQITVHRPSCPIHRSEIFNGP